MTVEEINNIVADILINDGPDGHCDGSLVIAEFIHALLNGGGKAWAEKYFLTKHRTFTAR
jgi:hypothetical protein